MTIRCVTQQSRIFERQGLREPSHRVDGVGGNIACSKARMPRRQEQHPAAVGRPAGDDVVIGARGRPVGQPPRRSARRCHHVNILTTLTSPCERNGPTVGGKAGHQHLPGIVGQAGRPAAPARYRPEIPVSHEADPIHARGRKPRQNRRCRRGVRLPKHAGQQKCARDHAQRGDSRRRCHVHPRCWHETCKSPKQDHQRSGSCRSDRAPRLNRVSPHATGAAMARVNGLGRQRIAAAANAGGTPLPA